ncbi:carbonic anhydrase family protein [Aliikangiella sp. IMCC44359]|uniref:carbonic anhydrase family protein n=1 Tax=Aliikangiella sp. IMCC44359 TaxID=3459125 RepID=UPI00403ABFB8
MITKLHKKTIAIAASIVFCYSTNLTAAEWGYDGQSGVVTPKDWGNINTQCNGQSQSPINIVTADLQSSNVNVVPHYAADDVSLENNGHTVNTNVKRYAEFKNGIYRLEQFHFHTKSEHTVDGRRYDMEMHFVNKKYDHGQLVDATVIGVLIEEGAENQQLKTIFNHLPHHGEERSKLVSDLSTLLPENRSAFHYRGSLTTPTCDEVVNWFVLSTPIQMSASQISHFRDLFTENGVRYDTYRPIQALNGRVVSRAIVDEIATNNAPSFSNTNVTASVEMNQGYNDTFTATDPDADQLTYSISGGHPWLTINPQTGEVNGTADQIGTYTYTITATDTHGATGEMHLEMTVTEVSDPNALENGVARTGLSGNKNAELRFTMVVPQGASNLSFKIYGNNGDADLYVSYEAEPTATGQNGADCVPWLNGSNETCGSGGTSLPTKAGKYYILVHGYQSFSNITLVGRYD